MLNLFKGLIDRTGAKWVLGTIGFVLLNSPISATQAQTVYIEYGSSSGGVRGTTSAIMGSPIPSPVPLSIDTYTSPGRSSDRTIRYRRDWDYDRDYDRHYRRDDDSITIRRTQIRDSTLINPVIIDSSIRDSTLVNPTIIDNNRYWNDGDGFDWERYNADSAIIFSSPDASVFVGF